MPHFRTFHLQTKLIFRGLFLLLDFREYTHRSGQIIATSHDLTPNGGLVREIPLFQGNLGW